MLLAAYQRTLVQFSRVEFLCLTSIPLSIDILCTYRNISMSYSIMRFHNLVEIFIYNRAKFCKKEELLKNLHSNRLQFSTELDNILHYNVNYFAALYSEEKNFSLSTT